MTQIRLNEVGSEKGQRKKKGREGKGGRKWVREKEAGAEEVISTSIPLTAQKAGDRKSGCAGPSLRPLAHSRSLPPAECQPADP